MISIDLGRIAILGKLPSFAEYLRVGISDPLVAAFDAWLTRSMDKLLSRPSDRWLQAYANGAVHGFVFRQRGLQSGRVLVGALAPSSDAAGRTFPLVIAAPVDCAPGLVRAPELLPLLVEPFWVDISQILMDAPTLTKDSLQARASTMAPSLDRDGASTASSYEAWIADLPLGEFWSLVHSATNTNDPIRPESLLRMLLECVRPVHGVEQPPTPLTLRLALGQAGGAAVCFWIDLLRRMAGWKDTIPSFFWAHDGTTGNILMHLGDPPASTLSELWTFGGGQDEVCDLTRPVPTAHSQWLPALPPQIAAACTRGDHSVWALLRLFGAPR